MKIRFRLGIAILVQAAAAAALADETAIRITEAPEANLVRARCSACHSLDYVQMNSPFLKRAAWEAEVRKMMKVMGAPVAETEVATIVEYLTRHYGVE